MCQQLKKMNVNGWCALFFQGKGATLGLIRQSSIWREWEGKSWERHVKPMLCKQEDNQSKMKGKDGKIFERGDWNMKEMEYTDINKSESHPSPNLKFSRTGIRWDKYTEFLQYTEILQTSML